MRAGEVMFADAVTGPDATLWGSRAANGVVAFYSRQGLALDEGKSRETPGITNFKIPGFYKVREFYAPDYSLPRDATEKPDYRTTLFWEPDLKIGDTGKTSVDFYTGDRPGTYLVNVEGITTDGRPIRSLATLAVEAAN